MCWENTRHRLAQHLLGGVTKHAYCDLVPVDHPTLQIVADDGNQPRSRLVRHRKFRAQLHSCVKANIRCSGYQWIVEKTGIQQCVKDLLQSLAGQGVLAEGDVSSGLCGF